MGGSLQLLFGIKGARWEDSNYNETYNYAQLMNEYWVRPSETETPQKPNKSKLDAIGNKITFNRENR